MPYEPRFYRETMGKERFASFVVSYKDSDLWIGIDKASYSDDIATFALNRLIEIRHELEDYISRHKNFVKSFSPLPVDELAPAFIQQMYRAALKAQTGPMAAVAGVFSECLGKTLQNQFNIDEIVVENGGDIFLALKNDLLLSVYAGKSPLSGKIGIEIKAEESPLGICTSAGTVGPSTSFGKADAVVVACHNTALADALATSIGNHVKTATDIEAQLKTFDQYPEILSLLIIAENKVGIKGKFELKPIK
jgi:uncharacterized protein